MSRSSVSVKLLIAGALACFFLALGVYGAGHHAGPTTFASQRIAASNVSQTYGTNKIDWP